MVERILKEIISEKEGKRIEFLHQKPLFKGFCFYRKKEEELFRKKFQILFVQQKLCSKFASALQQWPMV